MKIQKQVILPVRRLLPLYSRVIHTGPCAPMPSRFDVAWRVVRDNTWFLWVPLLRCLMLLVKIAAVAFCLARCVVSKLYRHDMRWRRFERGSWYGVESFRTLYEKLVELIGGHTCGYNRNCTDRLARERTRFLHLLRTFKIREGERLTQAEFEDRCFGVVLDLCRTSRAHGRSGPVANLYAEEAHNACDLLVEAKVQLREADFVAWAKDINDVGRAMMKYFFYKVDGKKLPMPLDPEEKCPAALI